MSIQNSIGYGVINDPTMSSASSDTISTSQSIKTFVESNAGGTGVVGEIFDFGGTTAPAGCLPCDGSDQSRATYSALFAVIGTTWGAGDGSTTFGIPPSARRVMVGSGGSGSATLGNAVGDTGGNETVTLATGNMPAGVPVTSGTSGGINVVSNTGTASYVPRNTSPYSSGSGTATNIMQPSMVALRCIRFAAVAATVAVAATQTEMEAATSSAVFSAPGVQQYHPSAAKAWVLYNQATGPSVVASYNVTSVTDDGAGLYTVNWDNDFADTNYAVNVSTIGAGAGNNAVTCSATAGTRLVGAQQFLTQQLTAALDRDGNCVSAYGELA